MERRLGSVHHVPVCPPTPPQYGHAHAPHLPACRAEQVSLGPAVLMVVQGDTRPVVITAPLPQSSRRSWAPWDPTGSTHVPGQKNIKGLPTKDGRTGTPTPLALCSSCSPTHRQLWLLQTANLPGKTCLPSGPHSAHEVPAPAALTGHATQVLLAPDLTPGPSGLSQEAVCPRAPPVQVTPT